MMQPATAAHGAFLARPSWGPRQAGRLCGRGEAFATEAKDTQLLRRGRRAHRARFLTCSVVRVADIKLSRYKGENISLLSLPKKQPSEYQIGRKKLHKFFEQGFCLKSIISQYLNQK